MRFGDDRLDTSRVNDRRDGRSGGRPGGGYGGGGSNAGALVTADLRSGLWMRADAGALPRSSDRAAGGPFHVCATTSTDRMRSDFGTCSARTLRFDPVR
jgi:hypothetical protein